MITGFLKKIFGSRNDRLIKQYSQTVARINALEAATSKLSDEDLRARTDEFRNRHAKGETLDALLPEAFAVVREAGKSGARHAPFRHAVDWRHGAALRQDRRDAHR
jgi:preprotein translocase subunit SecA